MKGMFTTRVARAIILLGGMIAGGAGGPRLAVGQALPAFDDQQEVAPAAESGWGSWFAMPEFATKLMHRESSVSTT